MDISPPFCPNCLNEVPWRRVSSNENGNRGCIFASCKKTVNSNTSIPCNFFQWYPGSRPASQSVSPTLPSASQLQPSVPLFTPLIQFQALTAQPDQVECKTNGCKSTRIRKGCPHRRCKHHCGDEGGCVSHANLKPKTTNAVPSFAPHSFATHPTATPPLTNPASSHPLSVINPNLQDFVLPTATPPVSRPAPTPATSEPNSQAGPTHASHMVPVFTERWATEHRLREDQRKRDEERLVNARKAKHTVFVYAWVEDNVEPAIVEVQDGFTWPLLVFNDSLLSQAGMADTARLNLFRPSVGMWSIINRGLVMDLTTEGNRVFVKTLDVRECKGLVKYTLPVIATTRGRLDVTGERAYIRQRELQDELRSASASLTKRKDNDDHSGSDNTNSKRVRCDNHPAPYRGPAPPVPVVSHPRPKVPGATSVKKRQPPTSEVIEVPDSDSDSDSDSDCDSDSPVIVSVVAHARQLEHDIKQEPSLSGSVPLFTKAWPTNLSVDEVSGGFLKIEELLLGRKDYTVKKAFEEVFSAVYVKGTYYGHLGRWKKASQAVRNAAAGGTWSDFMKIAPAPDANLKAARKRLKRQSVKQAARVVTVDSDADI